jgi:hypothetical protein
VSVTKGIHWHEKRINMKDHGDACWILAWCGGTALGEGHEPYVMEVPGPNGPQYAKNGDFIDIASDGSFHVVPATSSDWCLTCEGTGADPDDPGEYVPEAGMNMPTSPCPDCKGTAKHQKGEER